MIKQLTKSNELKRKYKDLKQYILSKPCLLSLNFGYCEKYQNLIKKCDSRNFILLMIIAKQICKFRIKEVEMKLKFPN